MKSTLGVKGLTTSTFCTFTGGGGGGGEDTLGVKLG